MRLPEGFFHGITLQSAPGADAPGAPPLVSVFGSAASGTLTLRAQPAAGHAGEIRDDALAAPAVELLQTSHVVDGPDVHLHAVLLAVAHVFVREDLDRRVVAGEARLLAVVAGEAADAILEHERADLDRIAADLEDAAQREVVERREHDLLLQAVALDGRPDLALDVVVVDLVGLDLDVVADGLAGGPLAILVERRDALGGVFAREACSGVDLLQLGERVIADAAGAVGRAVEPLVVDDDEAPVTRFMHVHLDCVAADLDRLAEREHRVFRIYAAVAAVCHNFHAIVSLNK